MKSITQSNSPSKKCISHCVTSLKGEKNRSLESIFHGSDKNEEFQGVILRRVYPSSSTNKESTHTPVSSPLSNSTYDISLQIRRKSRSDTHLNFYPEDSGGNTNDSDGIKHTKANNSNNIFNEKTEDILAKALKIALEKQEVYRKIESDRGSEVSTDDYRENTSREGSPGNSMMMSTPPPGVQTDSEGLILPKKIVNPCLESSDRKNLHRELMFNNKVGKSVLNQKSELQRVLEKKRERQILLQQQQEEAAKIESGLKGELNRVILERAQKLEKQSISSNSDPEDHVNPEYLNARAKLRNRIEMK